MNMKDIPMNNLSKNGSNSLFTGIDPKELKLLKVKGIIFLILSNILSVQIYSYLNPTKSLPREEKVTVVKENHRHIQVMAKIFIPTSQLRNQIVDIQANGRTIIRAVKIIQAAKKESLSESHLFEVILEIHQEKIHKSLFNEKYVQLIPSVKHPKIYQGDLNEIIL